MRNFWGLSLLAVGGARAVGSNVGVGAWLVAVVWSLGDDGDTTVLSGLDTDSLL